MNRPYVVCHLLSSLDGRINGNFFKVSETRSAQEITMRIRTEYNCQGALNGTVTAAEIYADGYIDALPDIDKRFSREDWIASHTETHYAIALDADGTLNWRDGTVKRRGREDAHAVSLLTEKVSDSYLGFLREHNVSYLFAGKDSLDLSLAMQKLKEKLGIERLILTGGGIIDWVMLQAGLIDEVSLVIAPVADGTVGAATLFDQSPFVSGQNPVALKLQNIRQEENGTVWLNYLCERTDSI